MQIFSGERGIRTRRLLAFIFKMLGSGDMVGAPNFPPQDLGEFDELKIATFCHYVCFLPCDQRKSIDFFKVVVPCNQDEIILNSYRRNPNVIFWNRLSLLP